MGRVGVGAVLEARRGREHGHRFAVAAVAAGQTRGARGAGELVAGRPGKADGAGARAERRVALAHARALQKRRVRRVQRRGPREPRAASRARAQRAVGARPARLAGASERGRLGAGAVAAAGRFAGAGGDDVDGVAAVAARARFAAAVRRGPEFLVALAAAVKRAAQTAVRTDVRLLGAAHRLDDGDDAFSVRRADKAELAEIGDDERQGAEILQKTDRELRRRVRAPRRRGAEDGNGDCWRELPVQRLGQQASIVDVRLVSGNCAQSAELEQRRFDVGGRSVPGDHRRTLAAKGERCAASRAEAGDALAGVELAQRQRVVASRAFKGAAGEARKPGVAGAAPERARVPGARVFVHHARARIGARREPLERRADAAAEAITAVSPAARVAAEPVVALALAHDTIATASSRALHRGVRHVIRDDVLDGVGPRGRERARPQAAVAAGKAFCAVTASVGVAETFAGAAVLAARRKRLVGAHPP
mmetsp:Transcript_21544/g.73058  ORF Transcript_21544/g.73058 Transcript_21544/m.73058 type:complete len:480 (-) Transcript_21544:71-1510(-)